ncbi:hypothetical protein V8C26DRAFT_413759 [Trichoderma gracile]
MAASSVWFGASVAETLAVAGACGCLERQGGSWLVDRLKLAGCAEKKSQKLAVLLRCNPDLGWRRIGRSRGLGREMLVTGK